MKYKFDINYIYSRNFEIAEGNPSLPPGKFAHLKTFRTLRSLDLTNQ